MKLLARLRHVLLHGVADHRTPAEHKRQVFGDLPPAYRVTQPGRPRKQWHTLQRWRKAS